VLRHRLVLTFTPAPETVDDRRPGGTADAKRARKNWRGQLCGRGEIADGDPTPKNRRPATGRSRVLHLAEDLSLIGAHGRRWFLHGLHRSPYVGFSLEFASHRAYLKGDDLRHLNWKLYGRQDKLYIKQYDAETNLDLHLVIDWSGSMATDSVGGMTKQRYAGCLAAAVAHLALMQHDAVGLTLFSNVIQEHLSPRAKSNQLNEISYAGPRAAAAARRIGPHPPKSPN